MAPLLIALYWRTALMLYPMKPKLEAPFSRNPPCYLLLPQLQPRPQPAPPSPSNRIAQAPNLPPPILSLHHFPPVAIRHGNSLARTKDNPGEYYAKELLTGRLDGIERYLWLAGLPSSARPLHRQHLLGREIVITEEPNEHLVWLRARIFIKPLPTFLFSLECWERHICSNEERYKAACGLLLSYAWLVSYESDLRIAHETALLPHGIDWMMWTEFIDDFLAHIDLQSLSDVAPRYHYGELRLTRLDKISRFTQPKMRHIVGGYMATSTWYQDFFARNFGWLLAIFAFMTVVLSSMQVVLAVARGGSAFKNASYGFSIASMFVTAMTALTMLVLWAVLLVYNVARADSNNREVRGKRKEMAPN